MDRYHRNDVSIDVEMTNRKKNFSESDVKNDFDRRQSLGQVTR